MIQDYERMLDDCKKELDNIELWINHNKFDENVLYLVSYSIIKSAGTIEIIFKQMVSDFLGENVKKETANFITANIVDSSCNPNTGNIGRLLQQLDPNRKTQFDDILRKPEKTQNKSDLNSLVQLRNDFAHGRTSNATIKIVKRYFEAGIEVLRVLESVL